MIYATDLDRTLIFSHKFIDKTEKDIKCVEYVGDEPCTYMTDESIRVLEKIKKDKDIVFVPVTTRALSQYNRVNIVKDSRYAITSNGGVILKDGKILPEWREKVTEITSKYTNGFQEIINYLSDYSEYFEKAPRVVDDTFVFSKFYYDEKYYKPMMKQLDRDLNKEKWHFTLQGLKLYIIPKGISKESALKFLKNYLKEEKMVVSGDGKLDYGFLKLGDKVLIPDESQILDYIEPDFKYTSVPFGLDGTKELLEKVISYSKI